jgi:hypothetical protein
MGDNIKMDSKETRYESMDCIHLAQALSCQHGSIEGGKCLY